MKNFTSLILPVGIGLYVLFFAWIIIDTPTKASKGVQKVQAFCVADEWVIRNPTSKASVNPTFAKLVDEDGQGLPCVERPNDDNISQEDRSVYK